MSLFRLVLIATLTGVTTTSAPAQPMQHQLGQVAVQPEAEPRVEIGGAVRTIFDASGRAIRVE